MSCKERERERHDFPSLSRCCTNDVHDPFSLVLLFSSCRVGPIDWMIEKKKDDYKASRRHQMTLRRAAAGEGVAGHERIKGGNGAAPNVLFELMTFPIDSSSSSSCSHALKTRR